MPLMPHLLLSGSVVPAALSGPACSSGGCREVGLEERLSRMPSCHVGRSSFHKGLVPALCPFARALGFAFCLSWVRFEAESRQGWLQIPAEGGQFPFLGGRLSCEKSSFCPSLPRSDLVSFDLLPDFF